MIDLSRLEKRSHFPPRMVDRQKGLQSTVTHTYYYNAPAAACLAIRNNTRRFATLTNGRRWGTISESFSEIRTTSCRLVAFRCRTKNAGWSWGAGVILGRRNSRTGSNGRRIGAKWPTFSLRTCRPLGSLGPETGLRLRPASVRRSCVCGGVPPALHRRRRFGSFRAPGRWFVGRRSGDSAVW